MKVDTFEPDLMLQYIQQSSSGSVKEDLNHQGYADYLWDYWDGGFEHAERKQCGEILGSMNDIEDQIRGEIQRNPKGQLWLIVEGICTPGIKMVKGQPKQGVWVYKQVQAKPYESMSGKKMVAQWFYGVRYELYERFLTGLRRQGVLVRETRDLLSTAKVLVDLEKSAQHPTTTLQRHVKPSIPFHPDTQVVSLMGIKGAGMGEALAERLVGRKGAFISIYELLQSSPESVASMNIPGIGLAKAQKLFHALGKG